MRTVWKICLAVMTTASWALLALGYPGHLHMAEGNQMFLFTGEYARDMILAPGGLAGYIAAFILQFCHWPWLGALLISLSITSIAIEVGRMCISDKMLPLSLLPSLACLALIMDSNWSIAAVVGLQFSLWCANMILKKRKIWQRLAAAIILAPFVYQLFLKAKFYNYAEAPEHIWWALVGGTALICLLCRLVPVSPSRRTSVWIAALMSLIFLAGGTYAVNERYESVDEEIDMYCYLVRQSDWDGILAKASSSEQRSPLSTNAVNLALEMKGELGERMFSYFQNGKRSLINFEERKLSSEILFHLGFVNEAIHQTFEDMAGNPSRKRGVYHITRLAKFTAVDSTNSRLTRRYLATLDKTLFYRHFDTSSEVRQEMEPNEDFFFDFSNFQGTLFLLAVQRPGNKAVRDYLASSLLLDKNLKGFGELFGEEVNPPLHHRQAIDVNTALSGGPTSAELQQYVDAYNASRGNGGRMKRWSGTYWYYYNFR